MSRLHTMTRFTEPDSDPKPITYCEECGLEIYDGHYVVYFDGNYFCSKNCFFDFIGVEEKILYVEDY